MAGVLAKLEVGHADHPLEREADAVADRVMRMPTPSVDASGDNSAAPESELELEDEELSEAPMLTAFAGAAALPGGPGFVALRECASCSAEQPNEVRRSCASELVMRECSSCEDELQRACASCDAEDELQRTYASLPTHVERWPNFGRDVDRAEPGAGARGGPTTPMFASALRERQRVGGQRMPGSLRSFFEPRFATDLGHVRIHSDTTAGVLAQRINARAFTAGQHIFFAPGEYRPQAQAGLRLMAHELAHTLQNSRRRTDDGPMLRAEGCELGPDPGVVRSPFTASGTVIDLRAVRDLSPFSWIRDRLDLVGSRGANFGFKYGNLAAGSIPLTLEQNVHLLNLNVPTSYFSVLTGNQKIETLAKESTGHLDSKDSLAYPLKLQHPDIPQAGRDALALYVRVDRGEITGFIAKNTGPRSVATGRCEEPRDILFDSHRWPEWFGLEGAPTYNPVTLKYGNLLQHGELDFSIEGFDFMTAELLASKGNYAIHSDGSPEFAGCIQDEVEGLGEVVIPLDSEGSGPGDLLAQEEFELIGDFEGFDGNLLITYSRGVLTATGIAEFDGDEFSGSVLLSLNTATEGYKQLQSFVSQYHPFGVLQLPQVEHSDDLALTALGILDFHIDEWMRGRVGVFVGPDGELTAAGEWQPTGEVPFLDPQLLFPEEGPYKFPDSPEMTVPVPYLPGVFASAWASAEARGMLGPGRVHSLYANGVISTADYIPPAITIGGTVEVNGQGEFLVGLYGSLSAAPHEWGIAELRLEVLGGAEVPVRAENELELQLYGGGPPSQPDARRFNAYVEDELQVQGGVVAMLKGQVVIDTFVGDGELFDFGPYYFPLVGGEVTVGFSSELGGDTVFTAEPSFELGEISPELVIYEFEEVENQKKYLEQERDQADRPWEADEPEPEGGLTDYIPPKPLTEDFKMSGRPHTMYLEDPIDSDPVVSMRSEKEPLRKKVDDQRTALKTRIDNNAAPAHKDRYEKELEVLEQISNQLGMVESNAASNGEGAGEVNSDGWTWDPETLGFDLLVDLVSSYATMFGRIDLVDDLSAPGEAKREYKAGPTKYNPYGRDDNCGFCVISMAHYNRTGVLWNAQYLYDEMLRHLGKPNIDIPHWLLAPGQTSFAVHSSSSQMGKESDGEEQGGDTLQRVKDGLGMNWSRWELEDVAKSVAGLDTDSSKTPSVRELHDFVALKKGGAKLGKRVEDNYNTREKDYEEKLAKDPGDKVTEGLLENLSEESVEDHMRERAEICVGDHFVYRSWGHFQYLNIRDDYGLELWDPQRSNKVIEHDDDVADRLRDARFWGIAD